MPTYVSKNTLAGGGTLFPAKLVSEMFNTVTGHSSIAKLCGAKPIPFSGMTEFVFGMDGEAEIVGEAGQKSPNSATFAPVTITPIKFIYQHRVTDEFMSLSNEARLPILQSFSDGFAKKIARGIDIAAFHGINPYSGAASAIVGTNHFDSIATTTVSHVRSGAGATNADDVLDTAVQTIVAADRGVTGIAMSPLFGADMAKVKVNGVVQYPEFRFGQTPSSFAGWTLDLNNTVNKKISTDTSRDLAIVGDFRGALRWGYARNVPFKIIEFGDPDGQGDLQRLNQVCLRAETYVGWGILDAASFVRVVETVTAGQTS